MFDGQRPTCHADSKPGRSRSQRVRPLFTLAANGASCGTALGLALALQLLGAPVARAADDGGTDAGADAATRRDLQVNLSDASYQGGGIACNASGTRHAQPSAAALFALGAAGALLLLRGRRRRDQRRAALMLGALGALTAAAAPGVASAQIAVDAVTFRPSLLPGGVLAVDGSQTLPRLTGTGMALFSYGSNPLLLNIPGGGQGFSAGVSGQGLMSMGLAVGLTNAITVGIDLPVMLWQGVGDDSLERRIRTPADASSVATTPGSTSAGTAASTSGAPISLPSRGGVGDIRILFKVQLKDNRAGGLGIALMPMVTAPTGDANSYLGWGAGSVEGRLIMDYRFGDKVLLAANGSFFSHNVTRAQNLTLSHELRYGLGVLYSITDSVATFIEVFGRLGLVDRDGGVGVTTANSPAEGLLGMRYRHESGVTLQVGAGLGLNQGYGAPGARVFAGVGYTPFGDRVSTTRPSDDDEGDKTDKGTTPPVEQGGGVTQAPVTQAPVTPVQRVDTDGDGVDDEVDRCPRQPGPTANMGCPERDEDGDGVIDRLDQCPTVPGTKEALGCPAPTQQPVQQPPVVQQPPGAGGTQIVGWRFNLAEPIAFVPGFAVLMERSEPVLRDVAKILNDRPDLKVTVEGYVDDPNLSAARQKNLSKERAEAVAKRLVKAGVPRARVATTGYGGERPLDASGTAEARERNTRVEIVIRD